MKKYIVVIIAVVSMWSNTASAVLKCNGKVKSVLSGDVYCGGNRVGFFLDNSTVWYCSANANMDTLIIAALMSQANISVRDPNWESCNSPPNGATPHHIWVGEI